MPRKDGKKLKMYYIAQFGTSPPRFAIEINDRTLVTRDFGFFVENRLRAPFGFEGVPLVIDFKERKTVIAARARRFVALRDRRLPHGRDPVRAS